MLDAVRSKPLVISTAQEMRQTMSAARRRGVRIGLVPTMGALHEGHLSLVRAAQAACELTVATIFVNPAQFGPQEDLANYPRTLAADLKSLAELEVDYVFAPSNNELYPPGFSTYVEPPTVAGRWEGECRPGHFRGVATVVLKLFQLIPADVAFFGRKDYQQCSVIRRLVEDFHLPIEVRICPIVREGDGLAMSSRNRYLNNEERRQARALSQGLRAAVRSFAEGERDATALADRIRTTLSGAGIDRVDYVALADAETLEPVLRVDGPAVALVAAFVGRTRLIDNAVLDLRHLDAAL